MKIVGLAGNIGAGKNLVASMIPGAVVLEWSDRLYDGLAAILGVPVSTLKDRKAKENGIEIAGMDIDVRWGLQSLGTDWGREMIDPNIWVNLTMDAIAASSSRFGHDLFAIPGTRFRNETKAIRDRGGEIWWVARDSATPTSHCSDHQLSPAMCDRIIDNNGTPDELRVRVMAACVAAGLVREPCVK